MDNSGTLIVATDKGTLVLFDMYSKMLESESSNVLRPDKCIKLERYYSLQFSDDYKLLFTAGDMGISIWNWGELKISNDENIKPIARLEADRITGSFGAVGPSIETNVIVVDSDRKLIFGGTGKGVVNVYSYGSPVEKIASLNGHEGAVYSLALSSDKERLLSCGEDGTVRFWNTTTFETISTFRHNKRRRELFDVTFDPTDQMAIAAAASKTLFRWDLNTCESKHVLLAEAIVVKCLLPLEDRLAVMGMSNVLLQTQWDGTPIHKLELGLHDAVSACSGRCGKFDIMCICGSGVDVFLTKTHRSLHLELY
eukprot:TRINITY_DN774155_c0_g1_i1.p1 TRINITY_DN774155_c0_g1~~TRINITY_DN774155_c0_g1_i1.p1  ORF type:complete len:357 (+),score=73.87 TRINITY_DN774155_c0_g1_i1:141-1073(+)